MSLVAFRPKQPQSAGTSAGTSQDPKAEVPALRRPLSDAACRKAVARETPWKLWDTGGLYLRIAPSGAKGWRFDYRHAGKKKGISFGPYGEVTLAQAREKCRDARDLIRAGHDPSSVRRDTKRQAVAAGGNTFKVMANEWLSLQTFAPTTLAKVKYLLRTCLFPTLGTRPVTAIDTPELLETLRALEARGLRETAHRARQVFGQVVRYAITTSRATLDPSAGLKRALRPVPTKHFAALTSEREVGALLRAIDGFEGAAQVKAALQLAPLVFVRPGELRAAEWKEIDLARAVWRIPDAKMKMRQEHLVPLSRQAVSILTELKAITGRGKYVFPSVRTGPRCLSENTLNAGLRRLGYTKDQMTAHGWRATARTLLDEQLRIPPDVIEVQLAHTVRGSLGSTYNRSAYLEQRREMMQAWAKYLDRLKATGPA